MARYKYAKLSEGVAQWERGRFNRNLLTVPGVDYALDDGGHSLFSVVERCSGAFGRPLKAPSERPRGPEIGSAHRGGRVVPQGHAVKAMWDGQVAWSSAAVPWPSVGVLWMIWAGPHIWRAPCPRRASEQKSPQELKGYEL